MAAKLPNFLVIGAAKSGTTALCQYLEQHPQVFMCHPKEPHFLALEGEPLRFTGPGDDDMMNRRAITDFARWEKLFSSSGSAKAIGEGSVSTLYYPQSIARINKYLPSAKMICLLRQPAERAFSAFSYMQMRTYEPCESFAEALAREEERIAAGWHHIWHYRRMGRYYDQLKPYVEAFGRSRLRVYLYDDFRRDPLAVLRDCFQFLEIDPDFVPPEKPAPLISGKPKSRWLQALVMRNASVKSLLKSVLPTWMTRSLHSRFKKMNLQRMALEPAMREELIESFREDILRLQELIDRDLSAWLKSPTSQAAPPRSGVAAVS